MTPRADRRPAGHRPSRRRRRGLRLADLWLDPSRAALRHRPPTRGAGPSGSTTPCRSGASCATRSPPAWSPRWATSCPRRCAPSSARWPRWSPRSAARSSAASSAGARLARRRGPLRRRHRPAARPGRHGRARPGQHRRLRRGPGDPRGPGPPLRRPARGGPPAAVRPRAVAARARAERRRGVRRRHQGRPRGDRGGDGPDRPEQPRVDAGRSRWRASSRPTTRPAQQAALRPPGDRARPGRGLGRHVVDRGRRRPAARRRPRWPRRSAAAGPRAGRPSRPSPRWSGWSCARAACARRPRCGPR